MKIFVSFIFLLAVVKLYAQSAITTERKIPLEIGVYTGKNTGIVSGIKIIMACADSVALGYIPAEKGNETFKLVSTIKNNQWLDGLIGKRYGKTFTPAGKNLLWLVRSISVSTDTASQYYFTRLKADIFDNQKNGSYQKLHTVDTILVGRLVNNSSYTTGIIDALDGMYSAALMHLNSEGKDPQPLRGQFPTHLTEDSISLQVLRETAWPVLKEKTVQVGIYASFQEFIRNAPSVTQRIWARPDTIAGTGHVKLFTMSQDSSVHEINAAWGVCFGGNEIYKYEKGLLIPIERSGNGFILSRYQDPVIRKNQAMYWRRVNSYAWPDDTNPFGRNQMVVVKTGQGSTASLQAPLPVATRIDMLTGELTF